MALSIASWNINPNRLWFVRMADAGAGILVKLYITQADAEADTNLQASGNSVGFGINLPVTLTNDPTATEPISLFQDTYSWHLGVSGSSGDVSITYRIKEFVELDEINDPIYRNEDLIATRAAAEIDAHTHAVINKDLTLGSHIPTLEPGDVVQVTSTRRGKTELLQVMSHRISGEVSESGEMSLTSSLSVAGYLALTR